MVDLRDLQDDPDTHLATRMKRDVLLGGPDSYPRCQQEARRLRATGVKALLAPSAALASGEAAGFHTDGGLRMHRSQTGESWLCSGADPI